MSQGAAARTGAESVWVRTVVGWHIAFWVVLALAIGAGLAGWVGGDAAAVRRLVALATLVALGVAYAVLAMPVAGQLAPSRARGYLLVLCLAVGATFSAYPEAGFLLFIGYPQVWFFSTGRREGVLWTVALTVAAVVAVLVRVGVSEEAMRDVGVSFGVSLALSVLLGLWISSVIEQSQQRADLISELEAARAELAEAYHEAGVLAERARVAREIHDTLAQGFTSIVMLSQTARARAAATPPDRTLDAIEETARENLAEARALVAAFTPVPLQDSTLAQALERMAARHRDDSGLDVVLEAPVDGGTGLGRDLEVVLLRAAQEALSNVRRHAGANRVVVRLTSSPGEAGVDVEDDGAGFDRAQGDGFGLAGMRGRVEEVGGRVELDTAPGQGTRVRVRVPVSVPQEAS